jgi:hypothetical protein
VLCDDDLFCTDDDFCDPDHEDADETTGCVNETDPCDCGHASNPCGFAGAVAGFSVDRMLCSETNNGECLECEGNADCDDDILCTTDACDGATGVCTSESDDANCPDPDFCDGVDQCIPDDEDADANGCLQPGDPCSGATPICDESDDECNGCVSNAECDDDDACTADTCDGGAGTCASAAITCTTTADCPAGCNATCAGGPPTVCGP